MNVVRKRLVLAHLPPRLRQDYDARVPYGRIYTAYMAGDLPAERVGGRIMVDEDRIPEIAALLGIIPAQREPA